MMVDRVGREISPAEFLRTYWPKYYEFGRPKMWNLKQKNTLEFQSYKNVVVCVFRNEFDAF